MICQCDNNIKIKLYIGNNRRNSTFISKKYSSALSVTSTWLQGASKVLQWKYVSENIFNFWKNDCDLSTFQHYRSSSVGLLQSCVSIPTLTAIECESRQSVSTCAQQGWLRLNTDKKLQFLQQTVDTWLEWALPASVRNSEDQTAVGLTGDCDCDIRDLLTYTGWVVWPARPS